VIANALFKRKKANAISIIRGGLMEEIKGKYGAYSYLCAPFCALAQGEKSIEELGKYLAYVLKDALLYYDGCLCIPKNTNCKLKILYDYHSIPIMGHSRFQKTYITIKKSFFWLKMKRDIC
jgi:hypothetical protein